MDAKDIVPEGWARSLLPCPKCYQHRMALRVVDTDDGDEDDVYICMSCGYFSIDVQTKETAVDSTSDMDMLDRLAEKAMVAIIELQEGKTADEIASLSYDMAEAMLLERETRLDARVSLTEDLRSPPEAIIVSPEEDVE